MLTTNADFSDDSMNETRPRVQELAKLPLWHIRAIFSVCDLSVIEAKSGRDNHGENLDLGRVSQMSHQSLSLGGRRSGS